MTQLILLAIETIINEIIIHHTYKIDVSINNTQYIRHKPWKKLSYNLIYTSFFWSLIHAATPVVREEPEKIRKWREEQKSRLEEKDLEEERRKEKLREQAKQELEDWYKHHEESIAKTKSSNR